MTRSHLADLGRKIGRGPGLGAGALLGATVAVATAWVKGGSDGLIGDAVLGAAVGTCVALIGEGLSEALASRGIATLGCPVESPAFARERASFAPFPYYSPSLSYPWSEH